MAPPTNCLVRASAPVILAAATLVAQTAPSIVEHTGIRGGLAVQVGCGRLDQLRALAEHGGFLVQALDNDPEAVDRTRQAIDGEGLSGRIWVSTFDGPRLPFADNVVNLLLADGVTVALNEVTRVLVPRGVAVIDGKETVKPVPPGIDEWTHHLHDPSGNAVARDSVVGPPEHLQWLATPLWSKHHDALANVNAMVSANGRVFAICEESPVSVDPGIMPDKWNLVARDAFNGILLWRVPIELWGTKAWNPAHPHGRNNQPTHIGRRLVATGDRVYVTLGYNVPVSELDAVTGKVLRVFDETEFTDAILCTGQTLILSINKGPQAASASEPPVQKSVAVLDLDTGKALWRTGDYVGLRSKTGDMDRINHLTIAAADDRLFLFANQEEIVCLALADGSELWRAHRPMAKVHEMRYNLRVTDRCTTVYHDGVLLLAQPEPTTRFGHKKGIAKIYAFDAGTGTRLWDRSIAEWGWAEPPDVFVIEGELWVFDLATFSLLALDPKTGRELRRWGTAQALDRGHHHRCYRNRAAQNFVLTSHRGIELFDLKTGETSLNPFVRGACQYGYLPCNGLLYATPHPCGCFIAGKLNGMVALAPETASAPPPRTGQLTRGPAYGEVVLKPGPADTGSWPTYRHDPERSGSTPVSMPSSLKEKWTATIEAEPTTCVVAEGKVLLAARRTRRLCAFSESTGEATWSRFMNGAVDSPPTLHQGMALCGVRDGTVVCLRLDDGEIVWTFRAAPLNRWLHVYNNVESASPVFGSVLVKDGTAYFTAGRSSYLDGGIVAYALDPVSGAVKERKVLATTGDSKLACLSDILVSCGESVFMRDRAVFGPPKAARNFLFSRSGLLDEAWFNRAPWSLARETQGATHAFLSAGGAGQAMHPLSGQYMVYGDTLSFSVVAASTNRDRGIFVPAKAGYRLNCAKVDAGKKEKAVWSTQVPVRIMAAVNARGVLFAAGTPDVVDPEDPWAALEGRRGGELLTISKEDGSILSSQQLPAPPVLDGLAAAHGQLFVVLKNGQLTCLAEDRQPQ